MPLSDERRNLLLKFIAGETDDQENESVEKLLTNNPEVFTEFEQLWDLWNAVGTATNVNRFNVDNGWEALLEKGMGIKHAKRSIKRKIAIWSGSAAACILVLMGWILLTKQKSGSPRLNSKERHEHVATVETLSIRDSTHGKNIYVKTEPGVRKKVKLPDGSEVWLNGGSAIRYSESSVANKRILYLRGQAFFDIAQNVKMPFLVKTDHATIAVLGTRFNVVAYPKDTYTEAVLTDGSIMFTTEANDKTVSRQITPGEKISLNYLSGRIEITEVDTTFYASWKEGKLLFRNEKFLTVTKAMNRKYDVNIVFQDKSLEEKKLNGYLEKESLEEALKALQLTLQFKYKIENDTVLISR